MEKDNEHKRFTQWKCEVLQKEHFSLNKEKYLPSLLIKEKVELSD
jgi:hypothetical protein